MSVAISLVRIILAFIVPVTGVWLGGRWNSVAVPMKNATFFYGGNQFEGDVFRTWSGDFRVVTHDGTAHDFKTFEAIVIRPTNGPIQRSFTWWRLFLGFGVFSFFWFYIDRRLQRWEMSPRFERLRTV